MKKVHRAFLLIVVVALLTACSSKPTIVGKWREGTNENIQVFESNKHYHTEKKVDGEMVVATTPTIEITYVADYTKTPHLLVLTLDDKATGEKNRICALFRFMDDDTIEMVRNPETMPTQLDPSVEGYTILKRQ